VDGFMLGILLCVYQAKTLAHEIVKVRVDTRPNTQHKGNYRLQ